eukprot:PhF_6_TR1449/c0_g1_i4/m.2584
MLFPQWATVLLPTFALVLANFFFSSGQILCSIAFRYVSVLVVLTVRMTFTTLAMLITCHVTHSYPKTKPPTSQILFLALTGFLGYVVMLLLWLWGLSKTSVSTAGIIAVLQPVISLFIAVIMKVEKYARYHGVALVLGILGNTIMIVVHGTIDSGGNGDESGGITYILGCLALISSCVSYTFFLIVQSKYVDKSYSPIFIQTCSFASAFGGLWIISAFNSGLYDALWAAPPIVWIACAYVGIISDPLSNTLVTYGLRRTSPMMAAISTFLEAFFNLVGGAVVLGETLSPYQCVGGVLLVGAVIVFTRGQMDDLKKKQDEPITTEPSDGTDQEMREVVEAEHTPMQL